VQPTAKLKQTAKSANKMYMKLDLTVQTIWKKERRAVKKFWVQTYWTTIFLQYIYQWNMHSLLTLMSLLRIWRHWNLWHHRALN